MDLYSGVSGASLDRQAAVIDMPRESCAALSIRMSLLDKALVEFAPIGSLLDLETGCGLIPMKLSDRIGGRIVGTDRRKDAIDRAKVLRALVSDVDCHFETAVPMPIWRRCSSVRWTASVPASVRSDPIRLLRLIYEKTARIALIDPAIHNIPAPGWVQAPRRRGTPGSPKSSVGAAAVAELPPTYRGMIDSLYQVGFASVTEIVPTPSLLRAASQHTAYHRHRRALFVAQKAAG